ncbi:hypothetical protein DSL92_07470 [Billgrantia gudaonensis]|uniref:Uncharacterized protein n=1 Tax=Billgrantia gudaonensis TaxID=376427 RepID=A0A3S0R4P8_9GAMM|nr:hypothetical protein DSL92_07470 [Halomonas gudaonensis]
MTVHAPMIRHVTAKGDPEDSGMPFREFAVAWLRCEQDLDLAPSASNSTSTSWSPRSTKKARSRQAVERLVANGHNL